jgi:Domain of unknown function (DUF4349)
MRVDHEPIDPEIAASLDAIDAVLAGEPVDAQYAELAEIALLLTAERPQVRPSFAEKMDRQVRLRFATVPSERPRRRRLSAGFWEAAGALAAGVALIVGLVVLVGGNHGGISSASSSSSAYLGASPPSTSAGSASSSAGSASGSAGGGAPQRNALSVPAPQAPQQGSSSAGSSTAAASSAAPTLQPPTSGRKVIQSAQLNLAAPPNRIDDVAQQVYNVIGVVGGVVENSTVTQGGSGGSAEFQLSIPSGSLGQAMSRLSSLNYASVLSRTDASQDITDRYGAAQRALADARALRTSLLKQLANATTTEQVDSLKAQIRDAEASISSDQATLNRLNHAVGFSQLSLEITARSGPAPVSHGGGGFGIGRAAHDAGRVLTVAAGVALIALAALTPVALVAALFWWVGAALRRRRREQALDSA